jgi:NTP pyrophosphatase (non-canonical NTP hydrolase)
MDKSCYECKYIELRDKPCKNCRNKNLWNPKDIKFNKEIGGIEMFRLPILDLSKYAINEQQSKLFEEVAELYEAVDGGNTDDICSECLDVIQTAIGILYMAEPDNFQRARNILKHELKLKCREANGGLNIRGWLNFEEKNEY